jgi:hypothetical protein
MSLSMSASIIDQSLLPFAFGADYDIDYERLLR